jgi:hypothetical protein
MNVAPAGRIVVFAGPSVPADTRVTNNVFDWRPPAQAGDVIDLSGERVRAIVILDGYFDERPSVRHKEILQLISESVPVLGAASMGALRAAELAPFGMIGIGRIFEAYVRGLIDGDDEVALVHGPEEFDWAPLTEPLINIRATLVAAARARVCGTAAARQIIGFARDIFFKVRTWPAILDAASVSRQFPARRLRALEAWLPQGRVDLKRLDARSCLQAAMAVGPQPVRPPPPESPANDILRRARDLRTPRD